MKIKDRKEEWVREETKKIYEDPWMRIRVDKVIRPNGVKGDYSVAEIKGGIGVVVLTEDKKIVVVGQYRYAPNVYSWEIPKGGFPTFNYSGLPLEWATEELEEETGIIAKNWKELAMVHTLLGSTNDKVYLFLATDLTFGTPHPEKTETIRIQKVTIGEFYEMVKQGRITDSTSITAVVLMEKLLNNKF